MSRSERFRPTGAAVVIGAMIGALALAGCGAGQVAQTSSQVAAVGGANGGAGTIAVRDAQIEFPDEAEGGNVYAVGGTAGLRMLISNAGPEADRLVSASSPAASSVEIIGDADIPGGQVLTVEGAPAEEPAAAATSGATSTPGDTATSAPTEPGTDASGTAQPTTTTAAAADGSREAQIVLTGLREDIRAGLTYPLVLTFERAGEIRLDIPVGNSSAPREVEPAE